MTRLPVIVGFGGINPAGRSSGHHGYRRLVYDQLESGKQQSTLKALAALMQCDANEQSILANTLVRKINDYLFDPSHYRANKQAMMTGLQDGPLSFILKKNQLPEQLPPTWNGHRTRQPTGPDYDSRTTERFISRWSSLEGGIRRASCQPVLIQKHSTNPEAIRGAYN